MNLFRCALLIATLAPFPATAAYAASAPAASPVVDPAVGSAFAALRAKAEQGDAVAQYDLGLAYSQGGQTARDPVEAFAWLTLAAEKGVSGDALRRVTDGLSSSQLAQARLRLESLSAVHPSLRAPASPRTAQDREAAPITLAPSSRAASAPSLTMVDSSRGSTPAVDAKRLLEQLSAAESLLRESQERLSKQSREIANLRADLDLERLELELRKDQLAVAKKAQIGRASCRERV